MGDIIIKITIETSKVTDISFSCNLAGSDLIIVINCSPVVTKHSASSA